jgi:hypothetical protein
VLLQHSSALMSLSDSAVISTTSRGVDILIGTGENGRMLGLLNNPGS